MGYLLYVMKLHSRWAPSSGAFQAGTNQGCWISLVAEIMFAMHVIMSFLV